MALSQVLLDFAYIRTNLVHPCITSGVGYQKRKTHERYVKKKCLKAKKFEYVVAKALKIRQEIKKLNILERLSYC